MSLSRSRGSHTEAESNVNDNEAQMRSTTDKLDTAFELNEAFSRNMALFEAMKTPETVYNCPAGQSAVEFDDASELASLHKHFSEEPTVLSNQVLLKPPPGLTALQFPPASHMPPGLPASQVPSVAIASKVPPNLPSARDLKNSPKPQEISNLFKNVVPLGNGEY